MERSDPRAQQGHSKGTARAQQGHSKGTAGSVRVFARDSIAECAGNRIDFSIYDLSESLGGLLRFEKLEEWTFISIHFPINCFLFLSLRVLRLRLRV